MRRAGFWLLYVVFLCACVVAADYFLFWRPFVAELANSQPGDLTPPRYVDEATMLRVGSLRTDRMSSFTRHERAKAPGVLRLCAFGDSFTYGDEVADGHDYPALLERAFEEHGATNVEVLNFGNPWYGFHQAYLLWQGVGRAFACDVVLLGPSCFQVERDDTFNHTNLGFPYYLHARYVLDGEDVRLVEVVGRDARERFDAYFSFFPYERYLRYDRSAPAFLHAVVGVTKTLDNPFYYDARPPDEEGKLIYARLLAKMADQGVPILLLHQMHRIVEVANDLERDNLTAVHAPTYGAFPLFAPGGHYSSFGNRWMAEQYFAALTGDRTGPSMFSFTPLSVLPVPGEGKEPPVPISAFDRIEARLDGKPIGVMSILSSDPSIRVGTPEALAHTGIVSLLALVPRGASIAHAAFVPVPVPLRGGEALTMIVVKDGAEQQVALGQVVAPDALVSLAVAELPGVELPGNLLFSGNEQVAEERLRGATIALSVGGAEILRSEGTSWPLVLKPLHGELRNLRAGEGQYVAPDEVADEGILSLSFERLSETIEIPIAHSHRARGQVYEAPRRLARPIEIANGRASLAAPIGP